MSVTNASRVRIELSVYEPSYRYFEVQSENEYDQLESVINRLLAFKIIRRSRSQWSSAARVMTIDGKLALAVDYSYLNSITSPIGYRMPNIGDIIRGIEGSSLFSKIVIKDGFHQIGLSNRSKHLTAFRTGK